MPEILRDRHQKPMYQHQVESVTTEGMALSSFEELAKNLGGEWSDPQ
jgi:hypothetical protein